MEIDVYFTMDRSGSCVMTSGFSIVDNHESFIQNMFFFFFFSTGGGARTEGKSNRLGLILMIQYYHTHSDLLIKFRRRKHYTHRSGNGSGVMVPEQHTRWENIEYSHHPLSLPRARLLIFVVVPHLPYIQNTFL